MPAELGLDQRDSFATVLVLNQAGTAPVTNAVVKINGIALPFDPQFKDYASPIQISPGGNVSLDVAIDGTHYSASNRQFDTYPAITSPYDNVVWTPAVANTIRWNSIPPRDTAVHLVTMIGDHSSWPANGTLRQLPGSQTSIDIPASQLVDDDYLLLVGIGELFSISGSQADSRLAIAGFDTSHVSVRSPSQVVTVVDLKFSYWIPDPLTIPITASRTLTLQTTWSDGGGTSVDKQSLWTSSNPEVVAMEGAGIIRGIAAGTAVVSASYGGKTATLTVNVFAPTPSPPAPLSNSVTLQVDAAHSGSATLGGAGPTLPLTGKWTASLNGTVSYPVAANGKVYVTTNKALGNHPAGYGTSLYALDGTTGAVAWGPVDIPGSGNWSGHAYDNGRIFVMNGSGELRSFNAVTGAPGWTVQLPGQNGSSSVPLATNGLIYVGANPVYAVNQVDGAVVWTGEGSSVRNHTLSHDGLFTVNQCRVVKFNPLTGEVLWRYSLNCSSGGGDVMGVYADNRLYVRRQDPPGGMFDTDHTNAIFDASTGAKLSALQTNVVPAISGDRGFYLTGKTLSAVNLSTGSTVWSFTGDQNLVSAPLVIDNVVVIGSTLGAVYMLDKSDGGVLWTGQVAPDMGTADQYGGWVAPSSGLGLGNGYLLVPAGNTLTGWKMVP